MLPLKFLRPGGPETPFPALSYKYRALYIIEIRVYYAKSGFSHLDRSCAGFRDFRAK